MIKIENLSKTFAQGQGTTQALSQISLEIGAGEIFGIMGMSGAGKSTLLRCLSLLENPTEGTISIHGKQLSTLSARGKRELYRDLGVVFQGYRLLQQKTVFENIAFPLEIHKFPKAEIQSRVASLLELVNLTDKGDSYPSQLSGGQQQRVAIARAIATSPSVLLCDEPTAALDPLTKTEMLSLLEEINRSLGVTIVIITHEMQIVKEVCHRAAVIHDGALAECDTVERLLHAPQSNITKLLLEGMVA